jgi:Ser/Thr protein kinase RdoA (MazF antagonist)
MMSETRHIQAFDQLPHDQQLECLRQLATAALSHYDLPSDASVEMINLSENATFASTTRRRPGAGPCACTARAITARPRSPRNSPGSRRSGATARRSRRSARPGRDGKLVQSVAHATMARPRNVVLFDWETGTEPSESDDGDQAMVRGPGRDDGAHAPARARWTPPHYFTRLTWDFDTSIGEKPHWGRWRDGMGLTPQRVALFQRTVDLIGRRLERFGKGRSASG